MRKSREKYSPKAKRVLETLDRIEHPIFVNDVSWALAEAAMLVTPTGEVHLHWSSHRGQGKWSIIQNPQWRGEICGTARCRRVLIEPLGGVNESVPLNQKKLDTVRDEVHRSAWEKRNPGEPYPWPVEDDRYLGEKTW